MRFMRSILMFILLFVATFYAVSCPSSGANATPIIASMQVTQSDTDTPVIAIAVNQSVRFRSFTQSQPNRLIIDLPAFEWAIDQDTLTLPPFIGDIQVSQHTKNYRRIVIHLKETYAIDQAFALPSGTLFLTLKKENKKDFTINNNKIYGSFDPKNDNKFTTKQNNPPFTIVIDPGHGGRDPGAVGHNGLKEKDVVLKAAKKLKKHLELTDKNYRVFLTRTDDHFIPLYERIAIAHEYNANLFISLHADSLLNQSVRGASFYTLSDKATDPQTAELAIRENKAGLMDTLNLPTQDTTISGILVDLAYNDTVEKSELKARFLTETLTQNPNIRLLPGPHRKAAFAVLRAPDIPSVLIELGFMSNAQEALWLSKSQNLESITQSIQQAVDKYYDSITAAD